MARKNSISAYPIIVDQNMTASITSLETNVRNLDNASIRIDWTGTPTGEIIIEALQEKDREVTEPDDWFTLDFGSDIIIDVNNTDHQLIFTSLPFDKIRLKYTPTAGSGVLNAKITAKHIGG